MAQQGLKEIREILVHRDRRETLAQPDLLEPLVHRDLKAFKALWGLLVQKATLAQPEQQVLPELRDLKA